MLRNRLMRATVCLSMLVSLCGCLPSTIPGEHEYILSRTEGEALTAVSDDDSLYDRFDAEVLGDPYLRRLLMLYEHGTEAFIATNTPTSLTQTVANKPVIAVDSANPGVLHDVVVEAPGTRTRVKIELALGVGNGGAVDLESARRKFPVIIASALLELMGLKSESHQNEGHPALFETTTPRGALREGFAVALDVIALQGDPQLLSALRDQAAVDPGARERLYRYDMVPGNGLRFRFDGDVPTSELRSFEEAIRTPGMVGTFFYRLLQRADAYYPQSRMLWFVNYDAEEMVHAKVMLVVNRMSAQKGISLQTFIDSYVETFPAERQFITNLAEEVFGKAQP